MTRASATLGLAALAGCLAIPRQRPPTDAPPPSLSTVEGALLGEANRARAADGLPQLRANDALDRAARDHAHEIAARRELDHVSRDPARATLDLRLKGAGVTAWRRIGENLATVRNPQLPPGREIVRLWLMSPPHRANLLDASFDRAGTGVVRSPDGTLWAVQVYGRGILTGPVPAGR